MTATISAQDAITAVHEAAMLGGNDGLTEASLSAMTGLPHPDLLNALAGAAWRGIISWVEGRWVAWSICSTCGWGALDDHLADGHQRPGVCTVNPVDYCAGYPLLVSVDLSSR